MQRRRFIAATATGIATIAAGCLGSDGTGTKETTTTTGSMDSTDTADGTDTTNSTATGTESVDTETTTSRDAKATFEIASGSDGQVKVAHMGGAPVTADGTKKVAVRVDGERATVTSDDGKEHAYFAAKESVLEEEQTAATSFPVSVGNRVYVTADTGATVTVVETTADGETKTLAEQTLDGGSGGTSTGTTTTDGTTTGTGTGTSTTTGTQTGMTTTTTN
ncbi:hypothetical protein [Haloarchaeobius sp. HME9146]|uniref:hypothetical protein n=1 Tax=Haloarchaeobius sp. HME9146 TaxID=2978732 RepID=UPI0021BFB7C7|nr:hypothetical protein [Haloarchaeobius sp. HME9146]MCT9096031.1 hypothetical protein [Haloarchaeobius sp. HME9146]